MQSITTCVKFKSVKQNSFGFSSPGRFYNTRVLNPLPSGERCTAFRPIGSRKLRNVVSLTASSKARLLPLQCGTTSLTIPVTDKGIKSMAVAFNKLLGTFAEKQNSQQLVRWDVFEFKTAGI